MSRIDSFEPPEANPPVRRGGRRAGGPAGFVGESVMMAWRWLTRMKTALYLLGVLGVLSLLATLIPQAPNVPTTVAAWRNGEEGPGTVVSSLIEVVGGYDMYGSPVFLALLLLLFLSLTACLVPRVRAWYRLARHGRPPASRHLASHPEVVAFTTGTAPPGDVLDVARARLRHRRYRLRPADVDRAPEPAAAVAVADGPAAGDGGAARGGAGAVDATDADAVPAAPTRFPAQVAAEKGIISREGGSLLFHLSFYVLLVAIVLGQLLGFTGQVGVIEGESFTDTPVKYWSQSPGRWWDADDHAAFTLTLDEFHIDWVREVRFAGQPSLFRSDVTVTHPDGSITTDTVGGNDPLVIDGMKVHQLDWGYAPRVVVESQGEVVHDAFVTSTPTEQGFFRTAVKAPAADPDVGVAVALYPFAPPGDDGLPTLTGAPWDDAPVMILAIYAGDLRLDRVQNVRELDLDGLDLLDSRFVPLGGSTQVGDVTVSFPELRRWVGFQVSYRPTVPFLLLGALLMLAGLIAALYAYRRRVWITAEATDTGATLVTVAGRAFQRPARFADEHADIVADLKAALERRGGVVDAGAADPGVDRRAAALRATGERPERDDRSAGGDRPGQEVRTGHDRTDLADVPTTTDRSAP